MRASDRNAAATVDRVVVLPATDAARAAAVALARALHLPLRDPASPSAALRLLQSASDLTLHDPATGARLRVEFTAAQLRRYRAGGTGGDPLRRAIGPGRRHVIDATAGFGGDAVHLAVLGYRVTAIERNPIVSALAQDALRRARALELLDADNPCWLTSDARAMLMQLDCRAATIYLDPMFPPKRKKSAAVRKEMNLLRRLAIDDADTPELLAVARAANAERVVVKRPIDAAPLAADVAAAYRGKLVRYDVYRPRDPPA